MDDTTTCIIFLDVYGVLNRLQVPEEDLLLDDQTVINIAHPAHPSLYIPNLEILMVILNALGPCGKIVVSSSWRLDSSLMEFLVKTIDTLFGSALLRGRIIGHTDLLANGNRSGDIINWIAAYEREHNAVPWIAIDDNAKNVSGLPGSHKVITRDTLGLTKQDSELVLGKLRAQGVHRTDS